MGSKYWCFTRGLTLIFRAKNIHTPPKHFTPKRWNINLKQPCPNLQSDFWGWFEFLGWVMCVFFGGTNPPPRWPGFFTGIRSQQLEVLWSWWLRARNVFVCWVPPQARRPRKKTPRGFFRFVWFFFWTGSVFKMGREEFLKVEDLGGWYEDMKFKVQKFKVPQALKKDQHNSTWQLQFRGIQ